jgi:cold shock CspA family protein
VGIRDFGVDPLPSAWRLKAYAPNRFEIEQVDQMENANGDWNSEVFQIEKGYGFIDRDDGAEIFVHINNCAGDIDELVEGQRIRFDEQTSPRNGKLEAVAVELL